MLDAHAWRAMASEATFVAARSSQAAAIAAFDRLVGFRRSHAHHQLVPRVLRAFTAPHRRVSGDPAEALDDFYSLLERLLALHREFALRLLEVLEPDPVDVHGRPERGGGTEPIAEVIMLRSGHQR